MSAFIWLMFIMKLPLGALLYLVWWATRVPEPEEAHDEPRGGGNDRHDPPRSRHPRPPRRGPHAEPPPRAPVRTRATGRSLRERSH